jgi:hypothetical protein
MVGTTVGRAARVRIRWLGTSLSRIANDSNRYTPTVTRIERHYVGVLVVWVAVLAALFAFQELFA